METRDMSAVLVQHGLIVGDRDARRNTDYPGRFMVAEAAPEEELPTCDGDRYWCLVGDDLDALVLAAYEFFVVADMYGWAEE